MGGKVIKACAVYAIEHVESGRCYIGGSVSYRTRWHYHKVTLRQGTHRNGPLQAAWSEFGESAFLFRVLEIVPDPWYLRAVEQRWLDEYATAQAGVFNLHLDTNGPNGYRRPLSTRAKIASAQLGRKRTTEFRRLASERMKGNRLGAGSSYCGHLKPDNIVPIFEAVASGIMLKAVGERFGVAGATIGRIIKRRIWTSIEVSPDLVERAQDRVATNRRAAGREKAKLRDRIDEVRARINAGEASASVAADCGVSPSTINAIRRGRVWKE